MSETSAYLDFIPEESHFWKQALVPAPLTSREPVALWNAFHWEDLAQMDHSSWKGQPGETLSLYLQARSQELCNQPKQGLETATLALGASERENLSLRPDILILLARLNRLLGHGEKAKALAKTALEAARQALNHRQAGLACLELLRDEGSTAQLFREPQEAERWFLEALYACESLDDKNIQAALLSQPLYLMNLLRMERREEALELSERAEKMARDLGNQYRLAEVLHTRGLLYQTMGLGELAGAFYRQALEVAETFLSKLEVARRRNGYGYYCFSSGDFPGAYAAYRQALQDLEGCSDPEEVANTLVNLGFCCTFVFDHSAAAGYFHEALELMDAAGIQDLPFHPRAYILALLGWNLEKGGQAGSARDILAVLEQMKTQGSGTGEFRLEYEYLLKASYYEELNDTAGCSRNLDRMYNALQQIPGETAAIRLFCQCEQCRTLQRAGEEEVLAHRKLRLQRDLANYEGFEIYRSALEKDLLRTPLHTF